MVTTGVKMDNIGPQSGTFGSLPAKKSANDGFLSILESMFGAISPGVATIMPMTAPEKGKDGQVVPSNLDKQGSVLSKLGAGLKGIPLELAQTQVPNDTKVVHASSVKIQDAQSDSKLALKSSVVGNSDQMNKQVPNAVNPVEVAKDVNEAVANLGGRIKESSAPAPKGAPAPVISTAGHSTVVGVQMDKNPEPNTRLAAFSFTPVTDTAKPQVLQNGVQVSQRPKEVVEVPFPFLENRSKAAVKDLGDSGAGSAKNSQLDQLSIRQVVSPSSISVQPISSIVHGPSEIKTHLSPHTLDLTHSAWTDQVARLVNQASIQTDGTMQVKVHPEGMGDLLISVSHTSLGVQIQMESNQMATAQLLGQQTQQMASAINQLGIAVAGVEVSFGQANLTNSGYGQQNKKSSNGHEPIRFTNGESKSSQSFNGFNAHNGTDSGVRAGSSVSFRA